MSDLFDGELEHVTQQDLDDAAALLKIAEKHGLTVPDFLEVAIFEALESIMGGD